MVKVIAAAAAIVMFSFIGPLAVYRAIKKDLVRADDPASAQEPRDGCGPVVSDEQADREPAGSEERDDRRQDS